MLRKKHILSASVSSLNIIYHLRTWFCIILIDLLLLLPIVVCFILFTVFLLKEHEKQKYMLLSIEKWFEEFGKPLNWTHYFKNFGTSVMT